jgi:hypothetical protein
MSLPGSTAPLAWEISLRKTPLLQQHGHESAQRKCRSVPDHDIPPSASQPRLALATGWALNLTFQASELAGDLLPALRNHQSLESCLVLYHLDECSLCQDLAVSVKL